MTDLCKNCGCCHLGADPVPCGEPLKYCGSCKQGGHTANFCPMGVYSQSGPPGPMYFMICSNCDRWHLPSPCQIPLQQCKQCGHYGHMPHYCPVNPIPSRPLRSLAQPQQSPSKGSAGGRKRKRQDEPDKPQLMVTLPLRVLDPQHVHPTLIRQIQQSVWNDLTRMLVDHTREDVLALLTQGVPLPSAIGQFRPATHPGTTISGAQTGTVPIAMLSGVKPEGVSMVQNSLLQNVDHHSTTANPPSSVTSPAMEQAGGIPVTPVTTGKPKKTAGSARCADCKTKHAKCPHMGIEADKTGDAHVGRTAEQPGTSDHLGLAGQLQENFGADIFTERSQFPASQSADRNARPEHTMQQQTWLLNTEVGDLNALANAAEQMLAQNEQATFNFGDQGHSPAEGEQHEGTTNPMDFSHLLNSDSASGPAQDEQAPRLHAQLQDTADAKPQKKRATRKKKN
ncbi:hypothetical protein Slin14017_G068220 [Septoria linicola]|nr:hypothetical protein Slin14017_G068220 [Septoria linicola]